MSRTARLSTCAAIVLLGALNRPAHAQTAVDTGWMYQGRLTDAGSPATGEYDLRITLYSDAAGTNAVGPVLLRPNVPLEGGLFSVKLDFGAQFTGSKRWLQLEVKPAGGGAYTALPLQEISSAPQALFSQVPWSISGTNVVYTGGNVGIGIAAPTGRLHVAASSGNTVYGTTSGGRGIAGAATSNFGGIGVYGEHAQSGNSGFLGTLDEGVRGVATVFTNAAGRFIHTEAGSVAVESRGVIDIQATGEGAELLRFSTERPWSFRQLGVGPSTHLQLKAAIGIKEFHITAAGGTTVATFMADDANPRLVVNGVTVTKVLQVTGADLAERFGTVERVEPGMVVEIDPDNPGQLRLARSEYSGRVAGVASGANDLPAGAILGNLPGFEDATPIALSGRVWTYCDAGEGGVLAINPGDLLTTSATPGHAMVAKDRERAHGAVIGKAMTGLESGKGFVLVLVNLQ